MALLARAVLGKVFGRTHDELCLVEGGGHPLGVYGLLEVSVHPGEVYQGLVVQMREDHPLKLVGQPLDERGHGR